MTALLASRPADFASPSDAVTWACRTGMCKSRDAAGVSVPSQVGRGAPRSRMPCSAGAPYLLHDTRGGRIYTWATQAKAQ